MNQKIWFSEYIKIDQKDKKKSFQEIKKNETKREKIKLKVKKRSLK